MRGLRVARRPSAVDNRPANQYKGPIVTASIADIAGIVQGIGSLAAVVVAVWIYAKQYRDKKADDENQTRAFVEAIVAEVQAAWDGYCIEVHPALQTLPDGQHFGMTYPILSEPFAIYNNGASSVGKIADAELRRMIAQTYALARGMIFTFMLNNSMLAEYNQLLRMYHQPNRDAVIADRLNDLRDYAVKLKERDQWMTTAVPALLGRANQWLASHPAR